MPHDLSDEQWQAIEDHLYAGRKITAIKLFRERAGVGLKEAKDVLDEHEAKLREQFPERFTAKPAGCSVSVGVLLVLVVALGAIVIAVYSL